MENDILFVLSMKKLNYSGGAKHDGECKFNGSIMEINKKLSKAARLVKNLNSCFT